MKTSLKRMLVAMSAIVMVMLLADFGTAQPRKARGKVYTKSHVKNVIKRVETRADHFVKNFDKSLDKSFLDGTKREDYLNRRAKDLEKATDKLKKNFDKSDRWIENKPQVLRTLNIAHDINKTMKNRRFGKKTEANWVRLRYELNTLAKIYRLPTVGSKVYR